MVFLRLMTSAYRILVISNRRGASYREAAREEGRRHRGERDVLLQLENNRTLAPNCCGGGSANGGDIKSIRLEPAITAI